MCHLQSKKSNITQVHSSIKVTSSRTSLSDRRAGSPTSRNQQVSLKRRRDRPAVWRYLNGHLTFKNTLWSVTNSLAQQVNQTVTLSSDWLMFSVFLCPDVGALSQLVMSTLDQNAGVTLPPLEGAAEPTEEGNEGKTCPLFSLSSPGPHPPASLIPFCLSWFQF